MQSAFYTVQWFSILRDTISIFFFFLAFALRDYVLLLYSFRWYRIYNNYYIFSVVKKNPTLDQITAVVFVFFGFTLFLHKLYAVLLDDKALCVHQKKKKEKKKKSLIKMTIVRVLFYL